MRFFRLVDDLALPGRWHVGSPVTAEQVVMDERVLLEGHAVTIPEPLSFAIRRRGQPLDFTLADSDVPLLSASAADVFRERGGRDVQLIASRVEGHEASFFAMNVLVALPCLDSTRSEATYWRPHDGRPDRVGQPRMVTVLRIDASRTAGHHVLRVAEWPIALIVSEDMRAALQKGHLTGLRFEEV